MFSHFGSIILSIGERTTFVLVLRCQDFTQAHGLIQGQAFPQVNVRLCGVGAEGYDPCEDGGYIEGKYGCSWTGSGLAVLLNDEIIVESEANDSKKFTMNPRTISS